MLRHDPIVSKYPENLPTDEEVELTVRLLRQPEHEALWRSLNDEVCIGGCPTSALVRLCWQAREEHKFGQECAEGALAWLRRCLETRQRLRLNSMLRNGPFTAKFRELYFQAMPFSFHGTSKLGHPVLIARYGSIDIEAFKQLWTEGEALQQREGLAINAAVLFHIRAMEYMTKVVMAEETRRQGRVVDRILGVVDVGGLGLKHLNSPLKTFLGAVSKESISLFPETMHSTVVANAPWFVARAAWPIVKSFLHPVTQAKFVILSTPAELRSKLSELMNIEDIPTYFGGACRCAECASGRLEGGSLRAWEEVNNPQIMGLNPVAEQASRPEAHSKSSRHDSCSCWGWTGALEATIKNRSARRTEPIVDKTHVVVPIGRREGDVEDLKAPGAPPLHAGRSLPESSAAERPTRRRRWLLATALAALAVAALVAAQRSSGRGLATALAALAGRSESRTL